MLLLTDRCLKDSVLTGYTNLMPTVLTMCGTRHQKLYAMSPNFDIVKVIVILLLLKNTLKSIMSKQLYMRSCH